METLVISPDFTIEDIHKIREQNYERTKDMTVAEKVAYYNKVRKPKEKLNGEEEESANGLIIRRCFFRVLLLGTDIRNQFFQ